MIRRIALLFTALPAGIIIAWLVVLALGISVRLDVLREPIETAASRALGREVRVLGPIEARPTLGPTLLVHDVRIADPGAQDGMDLLLAARIEARLGLIALLRGRPYITRLLLQDIDINLRTRADGSRNWHMPDSRASVDHLPSPGPPGPRAPAIRQRELKTLTLQAIALSYRDDRTGQTYRLQLDEVSGSILPGQPLDLLIRGGIPQQPYVIRLSAGDRSGLPATPGSWPLTIIASMTDARMALNGTLDISHPGQVPALDFQLQGDLPVTGQSMMHGRLAVSNTGLDLTIKEFGFGQSTLQGRVSANFATPRPHLSADLQAPVLDASPLPGVVSSHEAAGSSSTAGGSPAGRAADASGWLEAVDLDAVITVREFVHTPIAIRKARLKVSLRDGELSAPLDALIADEPFHGELLINRDGASPVMKLTLDAKNIGAGSLVEGLTGLAGIQGNFNHVGFIASTNDAGAAPLNGLDYGLNVSGAHLTYGNHAGQRPVDVTLDDLALKIPGGKEITASAHGRLLRKPFSIEFTGGTSKDFQQGGEWPVEASATGSGATLDINGTLAEARSQSQTRLDLALSGERLGDLADWFGVSPCAETPYTIRGQLIVSANLNRLQFLQAHLGESEINGDLDWSKDEQTPLLHTVMHVTVLAPDDIVGLMPVMISGDGHGGTSGIAIDMPILPEAVKIRNADIKLTAERLRVKPVEITDVSLSSQIRGGRLMRSPFHAHIGATSFTGYLDPSGAATDVVFDIEGNDRDSGNTLRDLFSSALRWAGSAAVVPLQWLFRQELAATGGDGCRDGK